MELNQYYKKIALALVVSALIAGGVVGGYYFGIQNPKVIIVKGVDNIQNGEINNADFNLYWQVWDLIKGNYLRADKLDNQELIYGSAKGLVQALDDPYSVFLEPKEAKQFENDISGSFSGIGAEIGVKGDYIVVISPLKDSPAEKAGLRAGDKILEVDDNSTANLSLQEAVNLIRGPKGSKVTLTVLSNGDDKPHKIEIIRDKINIPTVSWEMKENNIAHVQLFNFNEKAAQRFAKSLNQALAAGAQGIVLDLRNNPGGFLEVAVAIAGIFIEPGKEVVAEEFSSGEKVSFKARDNPVLKDFPMVILVNKGSASASEILAGALKYYKKTPVIGQKTFGKGTVQELKKLPDGSSLKITVAHWVLPDGTIIEGNGITPDYEVKLTEKDIESGKDSQLQKAIEILKPQLNQ